MALAQGEVIYYPIVHMRKISMDTFVCNHSMIIFFLVETISLLRHFKGPSGVERLGTRLLSMVV